MGLKLETAAFLRDLGMPEHFIPMLRADEAVTVTGDVLTDYLREAYRLGAYMARDHFVWHDVAALVDERHGV